MKTLCFIFPFIVLCHFLSAQKLSTQLPIIYKLQQKIRFGCNEKHCGAFINKGGTYDSATQIQASKKIYERKNEIICIFRCCRPSRKKIIVDTPIVEKPEPIIPLNSFAYPNPAVEYVYVDIPYIATTMLIMSMNGSILRCYNLQQTMQRKFFIGDLATGMYLFFISGREKPEILKVVKTPV
jgi:hypothetical protein